MLCIFCILDFEGKIWVKNFGSSLKHPMNFNMIIRAVFHVIILKHALCCIPVGKCEHCKEKAKRKRHNYSRVPLCGHSTYVDTPL